MSVYSVYTNVYTPNNCICRKRQELYLFMLKHMTDEQKFQLSGKLCQEVHIYTIVFMCTCICIILTILHILYKTLWVEKFSEFTVHIQSTKALSTHNFYSSWFAMQSSHSSSVSVTIFGQQSTKIFCHQFLCYTVCMYLIFINLLLAKQQV